MTQSILAISLLGVQKDSVTHMNGLAVYGKEGPLFTRNLSLENSQRFYLFSTDFTSFSVLFFFPLSITFIFMSMFDTISSNINEVISINISANVFVFGDF